MPISAKATEYTVSSLSVELKMDRRKVGRLLEGLEPHRKEFVRGGQEVGYYWMRDVFDHLMSSGDGDEDGDRLDPEQESAKLAEARRLKLEVETEVLRGELVYRNEVVKLWSDHIANCKARLRAIPHKTAHRVMAASDHAEALRLLETEVEEALNELAGNGIGESEPPQPADGDDEEGVESASEIDSVAVGRSGAKTKP